MVSVNAIVRLSFVRVVNCKIHNTLAPSYQNHGEFHPHPVPRIVYLVHSMRTYATVMTIIWPVGVPIALIIWLSRLSQHLDPPNVIEEDAIELRKKNPFIVGSSIAFVALEHRPRYWYYEGVFNLQRRLVLT